MPALDRSYWLALSLASYVAMAALQDSGPSATRLALLLLGPLALYWIWRQTRLGILYPRVELAALRAARVAATAALVWANGAAGSADNAFLELATTAAAGTCAVAASYALARIAKVGGLIAPPPAARSLDAAAFTGFLWGIALLISSVRFISPESASRLDPLTLDYSSTAASIGSLLVLIAVAWRVRVLRQLELGVSDRAEGAVALAVSALSVAIPSAAVDIAAPDQVLPAALILGSLGCIWTVLVKDPVQVSVVLRGSVAVLLLGVPTALLIGVLARNHAAQAGVIALTGCVLSILAGLIARQVARPLGPEQSRWLAALHEANQGALLPEPNQAVIATLTALKKASKDLTATPELWRLSPACALTVDVAGYLHERPAEIPESLCELALAEPERTLRVDTLKALQVQRPQTRPLLAWFEARQAFCATLVLDDDGPLGFLLLPRGERSQHLTQEEARAARILSDRISALLSITSTLARSRLREANLLARAEQAEGQFADAKRVLEGQSLREKELARVLARPLLTTAFSPAARVCLADVEYQAKLASPMLFAAPIGTDVTAWAAAAHLAGTARSGPFLVVDAALEARTGDRRWASSDSPWQLARGGTLFIRDIHLLPLQAQLDLLDDLTKSAVWTAPALPPAVLFASLGASQTGELLAPLPKAFAPLFKQPALTLPTLALRPEDLRSLVLDTLSRQQRDAQPLGIERRALQALMDHVWPGNERELFDCIERAAEVSTGPLLTLDDLLKVGLTPASAERETTLESPSAERVPTRPTSQPPRRRSRAPRPRARS